MNLETIKQYTRKGYVRAMGLITLLAGIATVYGVIYPSGPELNPAFLGRWESKYQYPVPGGTFTFNGVTEYFRNGKYNLNGTFEFSGNTAGGPFTSVVLARGVGTWTASKEFLTFTLTGLRTEPGRYKSGEIDLPIPLLEKLTGISLPDLNEHYLPGSSDELKIVSQEQKRIVLQGKDPAGNPFVVVSNRQP
ncbi:hypothetical protein [Pseudomonas yamanorum]|uniref:hypothetical protein n=1 Tax=Pseudomonas yamanorum TaxID=515393 RepID=UPI002ED30A07|nr:hypothetical protein VYI69_13455 [Pseudomonas yamanorum]